MTGLVAPYYYGGKGRPEVRRWIIAHLPYTYDCYLEPFAGMLRVMLDRPASDREFANDLNDRVVNWWQVVRERPDELRWQLDHAPHSEVFFRKCQSTLDAGSSMERALKFAVTCIQSVIHSDTEASGFGWSIGRSSKHAPSGEGYTKRRYQASVARDMEGLADRLRFVTLFNRPAESLLERFADADHAVIYCDPPYITADTSPYKHGGASTDRDRLTDVLRAQTGSVAISGYGDEWDHLGWERSTFDTLGRSGTILRGNTPAARTEVLWTNYAPPQGRLL